MEYRVKLVKKFYHGVLVDVGIGSGAFIEARTKVVGERQTYGYDINEAGCRWLRARKLYRSPYMMEVPAVTLWDVLEHINDFSPLLKNVTNWVFLAVPIFNSVEHVLRSKHFRPDEHFWYFTRTGLAHVMDLHGFQLEHCSDRESQLGREDILSFVFKRV